MPYQAIIIWTILGIAIGITLCLVAQKARFIRRNEFKAYSDNELLEKRQEVAGTVQYRSDYHREVLAEPLRLLVRLDREIDRRKDRATNRIGRYVLDVSDHERHQRDINQFDSVYGMVLKDIERKA